MKGENQMRHYLFCDLATGEEFIVGAEDERDAMTIANEIFADPEYLYEMTEFEAEMSGLDEY